MKLVLRLALVGSCLAATLSAQTILAQWRFGEADAGAANGGAVGSTTTATVGADLALGGSTATYTSATPGGGSTLGVTLASGSYFATDALTTLTSSSSYIVEMWLKPTSIAGSVNLFYNGNGSFRGVGLYAQDGAVNFLRGGIQDEGTTGTLNSGQWNYVALVIDDGNARVFVNSDSSPSFNASSRNYNAPLAGDTLVIGAPGSLDEVRISTFATGTFNSSMLNYASVSAVPEPSTYAALAGLAALGLVAWRRRAARA